MGENVGLNYRIWFLQKRDRNYFQRGLQLQASGRVPCQIEVSHSWSNGMWFKEKKRRWEVGPGVLGGCHFNHVLSNPLIL